jgi:AbrB family looped-hinge helix DNA binding protein
MMMHKIHGIQIYGVGKVGPKGQIVIPSEAREEMGFEPGDKVVVAGLLDHRSVVIMSNDTFDHYLNHMRKHYEQFGDFLNEHDEFRRKD